MKKLFWFAVLTWVMIALGPLAVAQEPGPAEKTPAPATENKPLTYYKVDYVLRELQDGKLVNTRNYSMIVADGDRGLAKIGARVPVKTGGSFQYIDVGVNINCHLVAQPAVIRLDSVVEVSSFALPEQATGASNDAPVIRSMRVDLPSVVPEGKQTVIGTLDDPTSAKRYEIAVTATKLK